SAMGPIEVTRLGKRHPSEPVVRSTTPYGETVYWIGPVGNALDAQPGTDFDAIARGPVSLPPLRLDLTHHEQIAEVRQWARPLCAAACPPPPIRSPGCAHLRTRRRGLRPASRRPTATRAFRPRRCRGPTSRRARPSRRGPFHPAPTWASTPS